ncbi:pollen-specific leucine-rich repeat extensin-like protein 4 [Iris pallida]|uniref:Pollen-specific leucine-rich repeat extensin-like protein 4 n=1 Tax=Iris pallida TaxID=29817 RepID=A0AAX6E490_IRIPA|nr:pollen-specific leucine-rich repeat extensin-like protein 4 [Iris pallida]
MNSGAASVSDEDLLDHTCRCQRRCVGAAGALPPDPACVGPPRPPCVVRRPCDGSDHHGQSHTVWSPRSVRAVRGDPPPVQHHHDHSLDRTPFRALSVRRSGVPPDGRPSRLQPSRVAPGDPPRTTELGEQHRPRCPDILPCLVDFVVAILLLVDHRSLERRRPSLSTGHMEIRRALV